jgi:hypothetical protein
METTITATALSQISKSMEVSNGTLLRIAEALAKSNFDNFVDITQLFAGVAAVVAVVVAANTLRSQEKLRSMDALLQIHEYFDNNSFFIRTWQLEQITREDSEGNKTNPWSIQAIDIDEFRKKIDTAHEKDRDNETKELKKRLINEAFAWGVLGRADMFSMYFFALRVHAWLMTSKGNSLDDRVRMLNSTFGHQLLSTFLDHQMVACRVRNSRQPATYYPEHYGLFDKDYQDLVARLAKDLFRNKNLPEEVYERLEKKLNNIETYLKKI